MVEIRPRRGIGALRLIAAAGALLLIGKVGAPWWQPVPSGFVLAAPAQAADPKKAEAPATKTEASHGPAAAAPAPAPADAAFDPSRLTAGEIKLLQQLSERRKELDAREKSIELRDKTAQAAEQRVEERIAALKALKTQVESLLRQHDEQQERQLRALVKIYETMKPKEAARIFDDLDMAVLLNVIERMKEVKTAPVLASMNPDKAKALTVELAERRKLPDTGG